MEYNMIKHKCNYRLGYNLQVKPNNAETEHTIQVFCKYEIKKKILIHQFFCQASISVE